jgi:hypothetical protein
MERLFTEDEANALLPQLTQVLTRLRQAYRTVVASGDEAPQYSASSNGSAAAALAASDSDREISGLLSELESLGVIVRDAETGLVDFAANRDGEPVYLCWRLGEDRVGYWHARDTGFMGREPL